MSKTIEVTGCKNCPFSGFNEDAIEHYCNHEDVDDYRPITMLQSIHIDCPLKKRINNSQNKRR